MEKGLVVSACIMRNMHYDENGSTFGRLRYWSWGGCIFMNVPSMFVGILSVR